MSKRAVFLMIPESTSSGLSVRAVFLMIAGFTSSGLSVLINVLYF